MAWLRGTAFSLASILSLCLVHAAVPCHVHAAGKSGPGFRTLTLDDLYARWLDARPQAQRNRLRVALGPVRGLSPESGARGDFQLDLDSGEVRVAIRGLGSTGDVWLVDNKPGPKRSLLPEAGDEMHNLGRLSLAGLSSTLTTRVDPHFLRAFQIDLVLVTPPGVSPVEGHLVLGSPALFERRRLRERFGAQARDTGAAGVLIDPANDPRVTLGLVDSQVLIGGDLFFRATFEGNGRTCGTCHRVENNLVIDVPFIRALRRKNPFDPLFVAERGHPNRVPDLEKPRLMHKFGLILENVDGFEDPTVKFLMRSVPHSLSVATSVTPPAPDPTSGELPDGTDPAIVERTGWSGDGAPAPGELRLFSVGAVIQHFTKNVQDRTPSTPGNPVDNFRLPADAELDALQAYMMSAGRTADLNLAGVTLTDPGAARGLELFNTGPGGGKCSGCHSNAGANSPFGGNRNFDTGAERVRIAALDKRNVPGDGGFGGQNIALFNFDSDGDGAFDSYGDGTFNTPPLIEAADTAPFFHTNAAETIEDAVAFYSTDAFNQSPAGALLMGIFGEGISLSDEQTRDVAAFLRVLNAAFNLGLAAQRLSAAVDIRNSAVDPGIQRLLSDRLVELAGVELQDALTVLRARRLNRDSQQAIQSALFIVRHDFGKSRRHGLDLETALGAIDAARQRLGTGLDFELGQGNLVF